MNTRLSVIVLFLLTFFLPMMAFAKGDSVRGNDSVVSKNDGGIILHAGFLSGEIMPIEFDVQ